ncbi:MAG: hypothetical protein R2798_08145 [Chitinophagales bacterium]|nr:hypothetical protein [Bacteroidota bacterium]MCB9042405.1 hypothetical protein [Chitinophagales bacterium]
MKKIQIIFSEIDNYEQNRFKKFLQSPYFNHRSELIRLLVILCEQQPDKDLNKKQVWQKMFGKTSYNDLKFRRLTSDLLQLFQQYKAVENEYKKAFFLASNLAELAVENTSIALADLSVYQYHQTLKKHNPLAAQPADFYYDNFHFVRTQNSLNEKIAGRQAALNFEAAHQYLDIFYCIEKLRQSCAWLNYQKILNIPLQQEAPPFLQEIPQLIAQSPYVHLPEIDTYWHIFRLLNDENAEIWYQKLRNSLSARLASLPQIYAREFLSYLQNYAIRQCNSGALAYLSDLLMLYETGLQQAFLFENNELSVSNFKNIVTLSLRLERYAWADNFIEKYRHYLPKIHQENAYLYNRSRLLYAQKKYTVCQQLLLQVTYNDPFYQLDAKTLLLKVYYDLDEWTALYALMESFSALLRRKKVVSDFNRVIYLNFIKYLKKLCKCKYHNSKQKIEMLANELSQQTNLADKTWLLVKVREL